MPRLIVVEDHKKLLHSLRRGLEKEGYEVIPAATGEEGYFQATTQDVDAIVLDLTLPGRVVRAGCELALARREFELLEYLLRHKNTVVTRDMLARDVCKDPVGTTPKTIDVFVTLLRKKVERPEARQLLHTVRGVGYAL